MHILRNSLKERKKKRARYYKDQSFFFFPQGVKEVNDYLSSFTTRGKRV